MPLPFFVCFWKVLWRIAKDCERWRFALADRGLDYEINLPVTVSVMNLQKSPDRKGLGIEIILP